MKYNFDEVIDRTNTNALNPDGFRGYIFHAGPEKVFPCAILHLGLERIRDAIMGDRVKI